MTSFRRVAFPLSFAAILGGALLFSLSTAKGQTAATPMAPPAAPSASIPGGPSSTGNTAVGGSSAGAGAAAPVTSTGAPTFPQTIGVSPVFPRTQSGTKIFTVLGGTGNETYDLQIENLYSLLRERGAPIPNVLHPLSTAKPSFILEKLIVVSLTGATTNTNTSGSSSSSGTSPSTSPSAAGASGTAAQAPAGPTDAEKTVVLVRRIVDAEIARGTGRQGGAHRKKLQYLSRAIRYLEQANQIGSIVSQVINGAQGASGSPSGGAASDDKSKLDPREIFYGQARAYARAADRFTPNIP